MEHVLELKNISHSYHNTEGETPALKELSFFLKKGEFISIVGPSGCGKSTLLSLIAGLLIPDTNQWKTIERKHYKYWIHVTKRSSV